MGLYILRRVWSGVLLALLVTAITFLMLNTSIDGSVANMLGPAATAETIAAQKQELGLDRPVLVRYFEWLVNAFQGDFGISYSTSESVGSAVASRFAVTLSLVIVALILSVVLSVVLGVLAATRRGAIDRFVQGLSLVGSIIPNLLVAIVLVLIFAIGFSLLPATGYTPITASPSMWAASIALPVAVLVIDGIAKMTAQIRGSMIEELDKEYVRTLRSRGIRRGAIVYRHALRNAASPALIVLSLQFIEMLGGSIIIENVFGLPGLGAFSYSAALQGDIPVMMGVTLFSVILVVCVNLAADLLNGWLNPKARVY